MLFHLAPIIILILSLSSSSFGYGSPFAQSVAIQEMVMHGKEAYLKRCSGCHGINGDGKGEATKFLNPKPRDFTSGIFKFRSSDIGTLPSDQDLMKTLSQGILGTSMPAYDLVSERERLAIIEYIKTLSPNWKDKSQKAPAIIGAAFPVETFSNHQAFITSAIRGRKIYIEACLSCHGKTGLGDGEAGKELVDEWGEIIIPANLRLPYIKRGKTIQDIYQTILTGVNGTPMPGFKGSYKDEELWDLAAFVFYLRGEEAGLYQDKDKIPQITDKEIN